MSNKLDPREIFQALQDTQFYPDKPAGIEYIQTQMSIIFLTGKYAYKIKKPVNLGYLDYTTLDNRRYFSYQELELNRRLSPEIYLEVIPIKWNQGRIQLNGEGEVIDYVLKMKQLPQDKMLDNLLMKGNVDDEMIKQVAEKMAVFHSQAMTDSRISSFGSAESVQVNIDENRTQAEKYIGVSLPLWEYQAINEFNRRFMADNLALFQKRAAGGRIRDCHGDMHAAHVCFFEGIQIYDCIEFNERFRYTDVAAEIAFLAMDLERYHRPDLSRIFVDSYIEVSGDNEIRKLINFYKCYRACVRGKVESFKLDDKMIKDKSKALESAKNYFHLAYGYTRAKPLLILFSGLMGTGKSTLAGTLSSETGFKVISSDITRKRMAGVSPLERHFEQFNSGIYSSESTDATYESMFSAAADYLSSGQSVILDASFKKRELRKKAMETAEKNNSDIFIIECILDESEVKKRLDKRVAEGSISDGRWEIFETQKQDFDKITEFPRGQHIIINNSVPVSISVKIIMEGVL
jgi:aminoglycoside phosphotransferase family enzyme/predicted kinase